MKQYWLEKGKEKEFLCDSRKGVCGKIFLDLNIKEVENNEITLLLVLENTKLPKNTKIDFEIYKYNPTKNASSSAFYKNIGVRVGEDAIKEIVDERGNAVAEWTILLNDLTNAEYDGEDHFYFEPLVNGVNINGIERVGLTRMGMDGNNIMFSTKTGDCIGNIPCNNLPNDACEYSNCVWNNEGDYCEGSESLSCRVIEDELTCKTYKDFCNWKKYSFWKKLGLKIRRFFA